MSGNNEHAENFILFLVVGGLVAAGVLYTLILFWPYFVFYILPFVLGSLLVGGVIRLSTMPIEGAKDVRFQYKRLAIVYPALIILTLMIFEAGSERRIIVDKKGNEKGHILEWPGIYHAFNEYRSSSYAGSPFKSLKEKAQEEQSYDRAEMGGIMWLCLFFGGPAFFFWLSRKDENEDEKEIEKRVEERSGHRYRIIHEKEANIEQIVAQSNRKFEEKIRQLESGYSRILSENMVLKAKVEFSPDIPRPPESVKTGGILDKDIL